MKELADIIQAYDAALASGKRSALATVVRVEGSSYRRPGARMLVTEDGQITGAISGGCLEGDALRKAQYALFQQKAKLVIYDTSQADDLKFGVQLGCNGIISILFEPLGMEAPGPMDLLRQTLSRRSPSLLVTRFGKDRETAHTGTCGWLSEEDAIWLTGGDDFQEEAKDLLHSKSSAVREGKGGQVLYQFLPPAIRLVIVGAGNDAQPLVGLASILGWETVVVDGRASHAQPHRFPDAGRVLVSRAADLLSQIDVDTNTAFVLVTHNYPYDLDLLEQLVKTPCPYIGVLGPRKKMNRLIDDLATRGTVLSEDQLSRIYGPVGLDIGAEAAPEIALSVVAEVKARFSGRDGASLRYRQGGIYEETGNKATNNQ